MIWAVNRHGPPTSLRGNPAADNQGSTRLDQLEDDAPIFLSYRKRQFGYSGFRLVFGRLLRQAQDHFRSRSELFAAGTCDGSCASIRLEPACVGEASGIVADLSEQACRGQLAQPRKAGEDGHLLMLLKDKSSRLGEVIGCQGGGLEFPNNASTSTLASRTCDFCTR